MDVDDIGLRASWCRDRRIEQRRVGARGWGASPRSRGARNRKHLVTGNNDGRATINLAGSISVVPYAELTLDGSGSVLCHYTFQAWSNMGRGWLNLHGHSHGRLAALPRQVDVGADAWGPAQ